MEKNLENNEKIYQLNTLSGNFILDNQYKNQESLINSEELQHIIIVDQLMNLYKNFEKVLS